MQAQIVQTDQQLRDAFSVRKQVFVEEQHVSAEEEYDQFEKTAKHVVIYDDDIPVGAGRFRIAQGIGKMERICVLSSHRKKGIGKIIMDALEAYAKEESLPKLKLHAQTHAESFYKKLGYETVSDVFMEADIPHVVMIKEI
ncbi:GNAT family N-acetyltransferase [Bacillus pseudomycoides]|uniref:GNAT family N-acetyltransferase n=1 Tax=Bacillus pseudomycoides TaxID=64104 RepID=A0A2C3PPK2_9BACI|nr:GNAT family N-acetyltransferase [Bacillus pseudomycoides]PDY48800.1 GNAT family N-acetyltransferase [Bacillus pseudomycoides]PEA81296.1 GNAT family N-acetyltransferase [Bacillus pseudomycoides]PED05626.1 GNAT family N-acetyltransferase [Bacillus pseudomycoides]PED71698.1 GNAT family N-acetyltransferase [Bacillus pseudomycoides]PEI39869.1 GNAT family N-acetyltransferase [Bacillus pseudomycoides]